MDNVSLFFLHKHEWIPNKCFFLYSFIASKQKLTEVPNMWLAYVLALSRYFLSF